MFRYLCLTVGLALVALLCFDAPVVESEKVNEVQELKAQVESLIESNARLRLQIEDLYCMTQPLRIRIHDESEGKFYYTHIGENYYRMLPSEVAKAELYYELRSASGLGYSAEKTRALSDDFMTMIKKAHFKTYKAEGYIYHKNMLQYHPDLKMYVVFQHFYGK